MEYVVLGVQSWEIEDEKTRKIKEGISVHYLDPASPAEREGSEGIFPIKITGKPSLKSSFTTLPGKYNLDLAIKPGSAGKAPKVELNGARYVSGVTFTPVTKPQTPKP